jgi:hypothetical protein
MVFDNLKQRGATFEASVLCSALIVPSDDLDDWRSAKVLEIRRSKRRRRDEKVAQCDAEVRIAR